MVRGELLLPLFYGTSDVQLVPRICSEKSMPDGLVGNRANGSVLSVVSQEESYVVGVLRVVTSSG